MKKLIGDYFTLSRFERNGMIVLLILIFIVIGINAFWPFIRAKLFYDSKELDLMFARAEADFGRKIPSTADSSATEHINDLQAEAKAENENSGKLFFFDPNTATASDWAELGAGKKLIKTIENYRSKGGKFKKPEDLKKIYGFNDKLYGKLLPWVKIGHDKKKESYENPLPPTVKTGSETVIPKIEINAATPEQLSEIPGMNESFASRMIKYRKLLGGFYTLDQAGEVYGSKEDYVRLLKKYCYVSTDSIVRISLNNSDLKTLGRHPYIGFDLAKKIINYRNKNGPFQSLEGLKQTGIITDENQFNKIRNYMKLWN